MTDEETPLVLWGVIGNTWTVASLQVTVVIQDPNVLLNILVDTNMFEDIFRYKGMAVHKPLKGRPDMYRVEDVVGLFARWKVLTSRTIENSERTQVAIMLYDQVRLEGGDL